MENKEEKNEYQEFLRHRASAELEILRCEAKQASVKEVKLMYEVMEILWRWIGSEIPDNSEGLSNQCSYLFNELGLRGDDPDLGRMEKIDLWLKWHKPEIAKELAENWERLVQYFFNSDETWENLGPDEIESKSRVARTIAHELASKLKNIARLSKTDENVKPNEIEMSQILKTIKSDKSLCDNLLASIDVLIESFREAQRHMKNVFLWRMEVGSEFQGTKDLWHKLLRGETYLEEMVDIDGWNRFLSDGECTHITYAITGVDATPNHWTELANLAKSAKKALWLDPPKKAKSIKDFLEGCLLLRTFSEGIVGSQLILYSYHWFELLFVAADDTTCPIRSTMAYAERDRANQDKFSLSCRKIEDDFCQASITALQLLRRTTEREFSPKESLKSERKQTGANGNQQTKVKEPSREAKQAYQLYGISRNQTKVAEKMNQEFSRTDFTQSKISRLITQYKQWLAVAGLPDVNNISKVKVETVDPSILNMGNRTDGISERQRHKKV